MSESVIALLNEALEGEYLLERVLGQGGMATVYLAHDARHDRPVAVKVFRPELAALIGAERFLGEIKTTANLQHPHILPLYDSGEVGGYLYYVMPYEVDSLQARLEREHELPVEEAIRLTIDVAEALAYAHRHGVVHRDIKPGNILLEEGRPQVADFGIALAVSELTGPRLTETGLSMGTPHYMSPEQASGEGAVDGRSDIFSLGCVLYEMLAGHPPFAGRTAHAVLARILTTDPQPVAQVRRTVPLNVEAALAKSLERIPADRFGTAEEFAEALADPSFRHHTVPADRGPAPSGSLGEGGSAPARRPGENLLMVGVAVAVLAAGYLLGQQSVPLPGPPAPLRLTLDLADLEPGPNDDVLVSPDGSAFAVAASPPGGDRSIWVRRADEVAWRALPGTEGGRDPAYAPDGSALVFYQPDADAILRVELAGGLPVTLVGDQPSVQALSWGPAGAIVFAAPGGVYRVPETGGVPELIHGTDEVLRNARVLPGGAGVLASDLRRRVLLLEPGVDSARTLVSPGVDPTYLATGHIVFGHPAGGLYAVPFDLTGLRVRGSPTPVLDGVRVGFSASYDVSPDGTLVYASGGPTLFQLPPDRQMRLVAPDGAGEVLPVAPSRISSARFSPDGRTVAFSSIGLDASTAHVYSYDLELGGPTQRTFEGFANSSPVWSPEGRRLAYVSSRETDTAERSIYVRALDEPRPRSALLTRDSRLTLTDWWGDALVFTQGLGTAADLWTVPAAGGEASAYLATEFGEAGLTVSPNGRWAAYTSTETETTEVYLRRFPSAASQGRISVGGGTHPRWGPGGDVVYYLRAGGPGTDTIYAARVQLEPNFVFRSRDVAYVGEVTDFDVHPDGERLLVVEPVTAAADPGAAPRVYVVTGWFGELRRRLGEG